MIKKYTILIASIIILLIYVGLDRFKLSDYIDLKVYDIVAGLKYKKHEKIDSSVIITIDDKSLSYVGQWPWSRLVMANLMQNIMRSKPAALGIDIIFAEPDRTSPIMIKDFYKNKLGKDVSLTNLPKYLEDHDEILSKVIYGKNIVLPVIASSQKQLTDCAPKTNIAHNGDFEDFLKPDFFMCNIPKLQNSVKNVGFINAIKSRDGLLRRYALGFMHNDKMIPSLSVAMLSSMDKSLKLKQNDGFLDTYSLNFLNHTAISDEKGEVLNYFYTPKDFKTISAVDVIAGNFDPKALSGKFVYLGSTAVGLSDRYSISDSNVASGIFAHASFMENFLNDKLLYSPLKLRDMFYALSLVFAFVLMILISKRRYLYANLLFFGLNVLGTILIFAFITIGVYLPVAFFASPLLIAYLVMLIFLSFILDRKEKELALKLVHVRSSVINSMMTMVESRDTETGRHIHRTREYAKIMATYLKEHTKYSEDLSDDFIEAIYQATPLHDIGKIGIPDNILKKPGRFDEDERDIMNTHAKIGYDIIRHSLDDEMKKDSFLCVAANIAYTHHEKWDGTGYPRRISGEDIPIEGRIVSLVDVYDALTSKRCYKKAFDFSIAEDIIKKERSKQFDPIMVDAFFVLKDKFQEIAKQYPDRA